MLNNKTHIYAIILFVLLLITSFVTAQEEKPATQQTNTQSSINPQLPNITVIATGGTIAGVGATETSTQYTPGTLGVDYLIASVPHLTNVANIKAEQIFTVTSQNMTDELLIKLANRVNEILSQDDTDGVVITHGTDTLEETAYFLNLVVESDKPVILVGAMRPATSLSADGPLNLYNAVALAGNPDARNLGVLVVMDDIVLTARDVTKNHIHRVDTFQSANGGIVGEILFGEFDQYRTPNKRHTTNSQFRVTEDTKLPRVAIIYANNNMSGDLILSAAENGYDGIVVAGTGDGNMSDLALQAAKSLTDRGIAVVRSSRIHSGIVAKNAEINDSEYGTVSAEDLLPQKARTLLKLTLLHTKDPKEIQKIFEEY